MAYVDPGTFSSGAALTAAEMNVVSDDVRYLKTRSDLAAFDGVSLARSSTLSCANVTWTDVPWSSAGIDVGGWWSSGATATVPVGTVPSGYTSAILEITASARWAINATGLRYIQVLQNGSTVEYLTSTSGLPGDYTTVTETVWALVADGDTIKVQCYQSSGGALDASQIRAHVKRIGAV